MVSPSSRRRAAKGVVEEGLGNAAQACRALGLARSSYYLGSTKRPSSEQLQRKIVELSEQIRVMATTGSRRCCGVKAGR
jgi:putative transposase